MSKWKSETLGIGSKCQLQSYRMDMFRGLLLQNNLDIALAPFWPAAGKSLEIDLWKQADQDYEARKLFLKTQLQLLSAAELTIYFKETEVTPQEIVIFTKSSLVNDTEQHAKAQAIIDNLPSWPQVSDAVDNISNLAQAKVFMKKLARVTYWLARNQED